MGGKRRKPASPYKGGTQGCRHQFRKKRLMNSLEGRASSQFKVHTGEGVKDAMNIFCERSLTKSNLHNEEASGLPFHPPLQGKLGDHIEDNDKGGWGSRDMLTDSTKGG